MHNDALFCFLTLKLIAKKIIFENKQHQFGCKYYFNLITQINDFIKVSVLNTTRLYERVEGTLTNSRGMMLFDKNYSLLKNFCCYLEDTQIHINLILKQQASKDQNLGKICRTL